MTSNNLKVVSIRDRIPAAAPVSLITQERLRRGAELFEAQGRIAREIHQFKWEVEAQLSRGAGIEDGLLTFDRELKIVRPRQEARPGRAIQFSIR